MFLEKIRPVAFRNTKEVTQWLVDNYHDYYVASLFFEKEIFPLRDMAELVRKNNLYKTERKFCHYYKTLRELITLKSRKEDLNLFLKEHHKYKHDDVLHEHWFDEFSYYTYKYVSGYYIIRIVYENEKAIGIKPSKSDFYNSNPFVLPLDGFESFIELRAIYNLK